MVQKRRYTQILITLLLSLITENKSDYPLQYDIKVGGIGIIPADIFHTVSNNNAENAEFYTDHGILRGLSDGGSFDCGMPKEFHFASNYYEIFSVPYDEKKQEDVKTEVKKRLK
jgi:hypothetical protein